MKKIKTIMVLDYAKDKNNPIFLYEKEITSETEDIKIENHSTEIILSPLFTKPQLFQNKVIAICVDQVDESRLEDLENLLRIQLLIEAFNKQYNENI